MCNTAPDRGVAGKGFCPELASLYATPNPTTFPQFADSARRAGASVAYLSFAQAAWRGQVTRWSLTMPLACINA